jgi:hypothetical protein
MLTWKDCVFATCATFARHAVVVLASMAFDAGVLVPLPDADATHPLRDSAVSAD